MYIVQERISGPVDTILHKPHVTGNKETCMEFMVTDILELLI